MKRRPEPPPLPFYPRACRAVDFMPQAEHGWELFEDEARAKGHLIVRPILNGETCIFCGMRRCGYHTAKELDQPETDEIGARLTKR